MANVINVPVGTVRSRLSVGMRSKVRGGAKAKATHLQHDLPPSVVSRRFVAEFDERPWQADQIKSLPVSSKRPTIVCPVQECLSLTWPTSEIAKLAMSPDLGDMPPHRFPSSDLAFVFAWHAASQIIPAVPLKPAARVLGMDPTVLTPDG